MYFLLCMAQWMIFLQRLSFPSAKLKDSVCRNEQKYSRLLLIAMVGVFLSTYLLITWRQNKSISFEKFIKFWAHVLYQVVENEKIDNVT